MGWLRDILGMRDQKRDRQLAVDDAMKLANLQYDLNRRGAHESMRLSNFAQDTPFARLRYEGTPGSADYRRVVELNPWDQANLDARRGLSATLLGGVTGRSAAPTTEALAAWDPRPEPSPPPPSGMGIESMNPEQIRRLMSMFGQNQDRRRFA